MTVCELRKLLEGFAPNADVWLSHESKPDGHGGWVRVNTRLSQARKEGQLVFLDGAEETT